MSDFRSEYKRLNAEQKRAVDIIDGPLLVIAGPGTGKTQLLSLRVANILRGTDINPGNILCLTYTESGKEAMINRLSQLVGGDAKRVEVHTFHGFGTRLIARFSDYFPELANFRPAEDLTLYETLYACLGRLPRNNPLSKQAYGQFVYQADATERISQLKRAGVSPDVAVEKAGADMEWCRSTGSKLTAAFNSAGRLSSKSAGTLLAQLEPQFASTPDSELGRISLQELEEATQEFNQTGKTSGLSAFKKKWFTSEDGKLHFKPTDQLKKLRALAELYAAYEDELKKRSLFDYDDMILFALEKLRNNREFLATVQETFQYILADEYQDTNAAQASIINLIADNPVHEGRPNVMVVGDDDQAIYGFQGALGDVLMEFRERWRDVNTVTLKQNYRSTPSIIGLSRAVISRGQNRLENYYEDIDKSLHANVDYANVSPTQFETASPQAVLDKAVKAAKSNGSEQLAIIATKHKYLRELADQLDNAGVNYYYEGREDLLKDPKIENVLLLSELLLAIHQKDLMRTSYVLPQIIAKLLVPVQKDLAWQIALNAKRSNKSWWEALLDLKQPEAKDVANNLKLLAKSIEPKDALSSLKDVAEANNWRITKKIKHLHAHAVTYFGRSEIGLKELLRYTELCKQAGVTLEQTVTKGNARAGVVLLSAHKSKGLEFDRVYVLHADYRTWFKERGRRNILTLPEGWNYLEPPASSVDDRLRLLYVVLTRARRELALIKSGQAGETLPGLEDIKTEAHISEELEALNLPEEQDYRAWYMPSSPKEKATLANLLKETLANYRLSPSHLTTFLDTAHLGPMMFLTGILLGISEPPYPEAIFGSHVHKTLHFAQKHLNSSGKLPTLKQIKTFIGKELPELEEGRAEDIASVAGSFINHSHVLKPGGVGEFNFGGKSVPFGQMQLTGTVDNYTIDGTSLTITDYKTGRALNSWLVHEDYYKQKLHRFRQQLMFYELLFRLSPNFSHIQSVTSKIAFVEPSRRDVYYELTLNADKKERDKLESLIDAVWQKIMALELPDVSAYGQDMQGTLDFEDHLISGQI